MRAKMSLEELKNMFDLTGKVAVVTGGSGGAGKAISIGLALYGADIVCTSRTLSTLEETAAEVKKLGKKALAVSCDVSDPKSVENMMKKTIEEFGKIDIMVTAAGIALRSEAENMSIDDFKKVMAAHDKPFLILQLDEHDSSVGYETRIEAAITAFKSHHALRAKKTTPVYAPSLLPKHTNELTEKTLLLPNWDATAQRLVVANLQKEGFDARLLQGSDTIVRKSLRFNSGQCIPLNIIAQEFIDYIESHDHPIHF